jgi:hypothetical protein
MDDKSGSGNSRRNFLKLVSVSAPAAAVAVAMTSEHAEAGEETIVYEETKMRSTKHTRAYFNSARF